MKNRHLLLLSLVWMFALSVSAQGDYASWITRGFRAVQKDSFCLAEQCFKRAVACSPDASSNALVYGQLGDLLQLRNHPDSALFYYNEGLKLMRDYPDLLQRRAKLFVLGGMYTRAKSDYDVLLQTNPDDTLALFFRAYIGVQQRNYAEARMDYEHLLRLVPGHIEGRLGLALLNQKDGRPHEALEQMNQLVDQNPASASLFYVRAGMETEQNLLHLALADYDEAIRLDAKQPDFYISRSQLFITMKDYRKARRDLDRARTLGGDPSLITSLYKKVR